MDSENELVGSMPAWTLVEPSDIVTRAQRLGGLQEVREITHQILSTQSLDQPDSHDNFGSSQIDTSETVTIRNALFE